jgi:catechol 2,3-dioxygenase-like lactoylglutathione lyase family enzyme
MHLGLAAVVVRDYDEAIDFFVRALGFELTEDSPAVTTAGGRPKRWVVVRPPGAATGLLLAQADGPDQEAGVGAQFAGPPRDESYGSVVVFLDVAGNKWDLIGPRA